MPPMPAGYEEWEWLPVTPKSTAALIAQAERRGAVKALRGMGDLFASSGPYPQGFAEAAYCNERADEIENGADL